MQVSSTHRITILAAAALLVACARVRSDQSAPVRQSAPASSTPARGGAGPVAGGRGYEKGMMGSHAHVPGTTVTSTDVDGGAAMVFTTTSTADVAELRRHVAEMAERHNERLAAREAMHPGEAGRQHHGGAGAGHEGGGMMGGGQMMMPAATATVEDVENGARLVFRPQDPAQLEPLREAVRTHAERMASGACPMMSLDEEPGKAQQETPPSSGPK